MFFLFFHYPLGFQFDIHMWGHWCQGFSFIKKELLCPCNHLFWYVSTRSLEIVESSIWSRRLEISSSILSIPHCWIHTKLKLSVVTIHLLWFQCHQERWLWTQPGVPSGTRVACEISQQWCCDNSHHPLGQRWNSGAKYCRVNKLLVGTAQSRKCFFTLCPHKYWMPHRYSNSSLGISHTIPSSALQVWSWLSLLHVAKHFPAVKGWTIEEHLWVMGLYLHCPTYIMLILFNHRFHYFVGFLEPLIVRSVAEYIPSFLLAIFTTKSSHSSLTTLETFSEAINTTFFSKAILSKHPIVCSWDQLLLICSLCRKLISLVSPYSPLLSLWPCLPGIC